MTVTEFLTDRYDDEESLWRQAEKRGLTLKVDGAPPVIAAAATVQRLLADVAAKRAIMENLAGVRLEQPAIRMYREGLAETTLRMLARPYAEHPDFDPAWRAG